MRSFSARIDRHGLSRVRSAWRHGPGTPPPLPLASLSETTTAAPQPQPRPPARPVRRLAPRLRHPHCRRSRLRRGRNEPFHRRRRGGAPFGGTAADASPSQEREPGAGRHREHEVVVAVLRQRLLHPRAAVLRRRIGA